MQISQLVFFCLSLISTLALAGGQATFEENNVQSYKNVKKQFTLLLTEVEKNVVTAVGVEKNQGKALKQFHLKLRDLETRASGTNNYETYMLGDLATRFDAALDPLFESFEGAADARYSSRCQSAKDKFQFQNNLKQTPGEVVKSEDRFAARLTKYLCP